MQTRRGVPLASSVAIAKADGATLWQSHDDEPGYSSPMRTGSLNQVIFFTGSRALAVGPRDGRLLWSYNKAGNGTANVATPTVRGGLLIIRDQDTVYACGVKTK